MSLRTEELKNRVEAKQKQLQARLSELKADAQSKTADEIEQIKAKLKTLQETVRDGWDSMTDATTRKLNDWLERN
jgi:hypothetical protein